MNLFSFASLLISLNSGCLSFDSDHLLHTDFLFGSFLFDLCVVIVFDLTFEQHFEQHFEQLKFGSGFLGQTLLQST